MAFSTTQSYPESINETSIYTQLFDCFENLSWIELTVLVTIAIVALANLAVGAAGAILYAGRSLCSSRKYS